MMKLKNKIGGLLPLAGTLFLIFVFGQRLRQSKLDHDLHFAARKGDVAMTRALLANGADVNARYSGDGVEWVKTTLLGNRYFSKTTPLIIAASRDHAEVVRLLLKYGANTELRDVRNYAALMWAEELKSVLGEGADDTIPVYRKTIKLLKQAGAKSYPVATP